MSTIVFTAVAFSLLAASARVWGTLIRRWSRGLPAVSPEPYKPPCWGPLDVLLAIALLFTFTALATYAVNERFDVTPGTSREELSLNYHRWHICALALASLATLITAVGAIMRRCHASLGDLGFGFHAAWRDFRLGVRAFLALAPPVYALQYLLVQWVDSKHPVVELLRTYPDPWLMLAGIGSAVVVAPLFEEFLFRGLLQGWLEKLVTHTSHAATLFFGGGTECARETNALNDEAHASGRSEADGNDSGNPYVAPAVQRDPASLNGTGRASGFVSYLPILASSALFAALHYSHGPDWVPLFVLALGLGYLYHQTHRLVPCITVHLLLNGCSMSIFLIELLQV